MDYSTNVHTQFVAFDYSLARCGEYTGNQKAIVLAIMSFLPNPFPSVSKIQELTGLCRNTVFKHLRILEEKKVIKRFRRYSASNIYQINPRLLCQKARKKVAAAIEQSKNAWLNRHSKKSGTIIVPKTDFLSKTKQIYKENVNFDQNLIGIGNILKQFSL